MTNLADAQIILGKKGDPPMTKDAIAQLLQEVPGWTITHDNGADKLVCEYKFKDYLKIVDLCTKFGNMAEQVNHHPVMLVEWGKLTVTWWTHVTGGLHRNDFIMAARCNRAAMLVSAP
jgi:4a-hydroxytetrahydrobiopterin dehydratase